VKQPVRSVIPIEQHHGLLGIMPVAYGDVMGAKLVTLYANNGALGLPTHLALIAVFRTDTGQPIAVMDGRLITEMRTAAVSAVAVKLLAPDGIKSLALLGSGVQARAHAEALNLVRKFEDIRVWSRGPENARQCAKDVGGRATATAEEAVRGADVVVTVTHADEPVLCGAWLRPGALVLAVGAVGATRREVDSDTMRGAVVVDSRDAAAKESGDILLAGAAIYAELGELLANLKPKPAAEITVFKSLGLAVEDIAAAKLVLDRIQATQPTAARDSH
jgi:thiomorpholine-carboxylate dehydrogenase